MFFHFFAYFPRPAASSRGVRFGKLGTRTTGREPPGQSGGKSEDASDAVSALQAAVQARQEKLLQLAEIDHASLARLSARACTRASPQAVITIADCLPFAPAGTPEQDIKGRL